MKIIENINYSNNTIAEDTLNIYLPENNEFSVFIYFHGGGIEAGDKANDSDNFKFLNEKGIAVVSANYRMYPTARYPEFIEDAAMTVAWVKENISKYGKCDKIYVGGSSAGGYLSMMLCFDEKYLAKHNIKVSDLAGFVHDAGQPTAHFNVLRERGIDSRRVIIDESAPIYHICADKNYPPMLILVSDKDMENRHEQTMLLVSTLKHFGYDEKTVTLKVGHGGHCYKLWHRDDEGNCLLCKDIYEFIKNN
ncbi:MAG: alpha/beta hydrolase [Clostridia bacterium]|nr:alpha/beta hydrolase [Clostridia bacterium]